MTALASNAGSGACPPGAGRALHESPQLTRVMTDSVEALDGLLWTLPGEGDRRRCLSVLGRFAAAGWSPALKLFRAMERPD